MYYHIDAEISAKETSRGQRVYITSKLLETKCKLEEGLKLSAVYCRKLKSITLKVCEKGTLSVHRMRGRLMIDLHNKSVKDVFGSAISKVSVIYSKSAITIKATHAAMRAYQRIIAAKNRLRRNEPLLLGETCFGIGGLSYSINNGFEKKGSGLKLAFANEIDQEIMEAAIHNNPLWNDDTLGFACPVEQMPTELLPQVDILMAGLSCLGASRQSRTGANKSISMPEAHSEAGYLAMPFYNLIASQVNPLVVIIENVPQYLDSASAELFRQSMGRLGYEYHDNVFDSRDFGTIERRKRMAMVFVTKGIEFDLNQISSFFSDVNSTMADIIDHSSAEPVPANDENENGWYLKARLLEREQEAITKGSGHRAVIATPETSTCSTIGASYGKGVRLDETTVESICGKWLRLMSPKEHAAVKGLPFCLVSNLGKTLAHKVLGNSVTLNCWSALGAILSNALTKWAQPSVDTAISLEIDIQPSDAPEDTEQQTVTRNSVTPLVFNESHTTPMLF